MISPLLIKQMVRAALEEDLGAGDITTEALIPPTARGHGVIVAKEAAVLSGLQVAREVFTALDPDASFQPAHQDGDELDAGETVASVEGSAAALLSGERTALNFLQRLSGIATLTRRFVEQVQGTKAVIVDTRKTTPGLRALEKQAVQAGGGLNHRFGLHDMYLIKDNHIALVGSIKEAVVRARAVSPLSTKIEVEVADLDQVREALEAEADVIMLDNMSVEDMKEAVAAIKGWALVEASGGVTLETVRSIAETGVDYISVGGLTHSAGAVDLSMDIKLVED
jgi:nicotinate-nucleotide pyrophosphorylase (carboxylating)